MNDETLKYLKDVLHRSNWLVCTNIAIHPMTMRVSAL